MTPSGSRPLERFSVLDLTTVRSGPISRTPAVVEWAAPMTGEHTRGVLAGLGYDAAALDALAADGVIEQY